MENTETVEKIDSSNYTYKVFMFEDRQAGIGLVYDPFSEKFNYNVYCLETKLMKEIYSEEFNFLDDAIEHVHDEFGQWKLTEFQEESSCGSCSAK